MSDASHLFEHSLEICRDLLQRAFPHLVVESVETLGEGWDSVAYLVNRSIVFRLPKRAEVDRMLRRERALLDLIADLLPVPVPRYSHVAESIPGCPYSVAGYPLIPGTAIRESGMAREYERTLARDLARFLKLLHAIDASPFPSLARERPTPEAWWTERLDLFEFAMSQVELRLIHADAGDYSRAWRESFDASCRIGFSPSLIHNDLAMEHLLVDSRGRLAGVIDFGDARLGDRAIDFAGLPDALAYAVIARYETDPVERKKLSIRRRFYRLTVPLYAIRAGVDLDRDDLLSDGLNAVCQHSENQANADLNGL